MEFRLPSRMVDEGAAVEESQLGEQHRVHERHSGQLLQVHLHREFVLLLLHHEGHLTTTGTHFTLIAFITRPSTRCRGESRMRERSAPASSEIVRAAPVIIAAGPSCSESSSSFYQNTSPLFRATTLLQGSSKIPPLFCSPLRLLFRSATIHEVSRAATDPILRSGRSQPTRLNA